MEKQQKKSFERKCTTAPSKHRSRKNILPPIESNFNVKTQLDLDPEFYSVIDGRPLKQNKSIRLYKQNIRDITLNRVTCGFVLDEILRIDKEIETEKIAYDVATKHFDEYKNSFEKFLQYDNNKTMKIIKQSEIIAKELANKSEEHKTLSYEIAMLRSRLSYIDESRMILMSFEKFLHNISPLKWQRENNVSKDDSPKQLIVMTADMFSETKPADLQKKLEERLPPRLYFTTPRQMLLVFETLEKQNLNYLLMTEEMNSLLVKVFHTKESLRSYWNKEIMIIQEQVDISESKVAKYEAHEKYLKEQFFKILNDTLQELINSKTALQLYHYTEYAYEHIVCKNDINDTTLNMAHALEKEYNDMILELEEIDINIVREIEKITFSEDVKAMRDAERAKKLLKNTDKMRARLRASYDRPYQKNYV